MKYEAFKSVNNLVRKYTKHWLLETFLLIIFFSCISANKNPTKDIVITKSNKHDSSIIIGDTRFDKYLPQLKGKKVGLVANQSAVIDNTFLVDTLLSQKVNIIALYSPEHGFRGNADAGATITDGKDAKTGLPIFSLYGKNKKPSQEQLKGVDVMLFDLQDVGVRFYTYISTLHYVMEACAESNIPLIVLDRPNPNAYYVDGPILEEKWRSFVGMHPVPIVYGMTIGEYAQMINGEKWLKDGVQCKLTVIPCENYTHQTNYIPAIPPSPNLRSGAAIDLYPSLCLFEATSVSIGRGTDFPFEVYGNPYFPKGDFSFTPKSEFGATNPLWKDTKCYGSNLAQNTHNLHLGTLNLAHLLDAKRKLEKAGKPFITSNNLFDKLAGTSQLREQILAGKSIDEIKQSWQKGLNEFEKIRNKYLIYE